MADLLAPNGLVQVHFIFYLRNYEFNDLLYRFSGGRSELVVGDVAGVSSLGWLEDDDFHFLVGDGPMFNASWHNQKFARTQFNRSFAELYPEPSFPNQKQLVLTVVVMPDKLTFELDELDFLTVKFGHNLGPPMLAEQGELLVQVDWN